MLSDYVLLAVELIATDKESAYNKLLAYKILGTSRKFFWNR